MRRSLDDITGSFRISLHNKLPWGPSNHKTPTRKIFARASETQGKRASPSKPDAGVNRNAPVTGGKPPRQQMQEPVAERRMRGLFKQQVPTQHNTCPDAPVIGENGGGEGLGGGSSAGGWRNSRRSGAHAGRAAQPPANSTAIVPLTSGVHHQSQQHSAGWGSGAGSKGVLAIPELVGADTAQTWDEGAGSAMRGRHHQMRF